MFLLGLFHKNAKLNQTGQFIVKIRNNTIPKWTIIFSERGSLELMRLLALGLTGLRYSSKLPFDMRKLVKASAPYVHIETLIVHHPKIDGQKTGSGVTVNAVKIDSTGNLKKITGKKIENFSTITSRTKMAEGANLGKQFLLAYGPEFNYHCGTDDFDFNDPLIRLNRIKSVFDSKACLTDPAAFLSNLAFRARFKRLAPMLIIRRLRALGNIWSEPNISAWLDKDHDFERELNALPKWKVRMLLPILDICRHILDAFPKDANSLDLPGVLLLHRPDLFCTKTFYWDWLEFIDTLLPNFQIILTLPESFDTRFPNRLSKKRIKMPQHKGNIKKKAPVSLPSRFIQLIQVDGRMPNLALMKLSRYFKNNGKKVVLTRGSSYYRKSESVFASCIFNFNPSMDRLAKLRACFSDRLTTGGSGIDVGLKLDKEIENLDPDYEIYPELGDRAIGFITRGCPNKCPFCIVPQKEGNVHQVSDLDSLLQGKRKKLILLDDNILSHPDSDNFLNRMCEHKLRVNFTQTLDIRFIDKDRAKLLKRLRCENTRFTRSNYYFSLNDDNNFDLITKKYSLMDFKGRDNVEFVCMYGYNTTLAQDVNRFKFLRSLPGAYVFVQQYRPVNGGPEPRTEFFFDDKADERIDELIGVCFTQNMKSMEKYYRWVSRLYVETFGRLHMNLVNTIFRYNNRHMKGAYIASLAGTRKRT